MLLARLLDRIVKSGSLAVIFPDGERRRFGDGTGKPLTMRINDQGLERRLFLNPHLALGEGYMDEAFVMVEGDVYDLLDLLSRNLGIVDTLPFDRLRLFAGRFLRRLQQFNPLERAQRNVAHHYDLSGALYDLFLDADRQYSCAYFPDPDATLDEAQAAKKRHIAAKLLLQPGQRVLDIGSGWGGLGLYLARAADVDVTGVTLSTEQHRLSERRAVEAGLAERVRFRLCDYRKVEGRFDRIVSVGMFEHVGVPHFPEFFNKVRDLLTDDGVALLHAIGRVDGPGVTSPWVRKYIFPGGYTPALSEVLPPIERSGLWVTDIEILRLHYAETLRHWRQRFLANRQAAARLYDERFCRMWEFYLAGSEVTFRHRGLMVFQIQLARRQEAVPLTRDYVGDWERKLERRDQLAA
jgi:cyclopropane-fatty-acyl-phospholipid synthase